MSKSEKIFSRMKECQLIALLTPKNAAQCVRAYEILDPLNVVLEIAFRTEFAAQGIQAIHEKFPDALVLAGTVMTGQQAERAIKAGAAGVVSPDYFPKVVEICIRENILCIPGGIADVGKQLVLKAEQYDCSLEEIQELYPFQWVHKLFPAFSGERSNMDLARSWKGPYKNLTVIYTGGITLETLSEARRKDPLGIFCASALTKHINSPEKLEEDVKEWQRVISRDAVSLKERPDVKPVDQDKKQRKKVVTFGELMMRLSPASGIRLEQAAQLDVNFGGAEANVAVALARFGIHSSHVTALPDNDMGESARRALRMNGVDTKFVLRQGDRLGMYFLEHGSGPRPSKVIYDRAGSSFSSIKSDDIDWDQVFEHASWFHWTGITPALGESVEASLRRGLETAKKKGITVSVDLNYRKKLWSEQRAKAVMEGLLPYVDILIGNEEDPTRVFGIQPEGTDIEAGRLDREGYRPLAEEIVKRYGVKKVAITLRESISASENIWSACLFDGKEFYLNPRYKVWIIDRVGTGDAFAAGFIYGMLEERSDPESLSLGVAAACLKHSIHGDFAIIGIEEVERLSAGEKSGRVQR